MNYYLKVLSAILLAAIITVGIFLWLMNLIGVDRYSLKSTSHDLIDQDYSLYQEFKQKYARVNIIKDNEFKKSGIRTIKERLSLIGSDYSNYFVLETTEPLEVKFNCRYRDYGVKRDENIEFKISKGEHIYNTFEIGEVYIKKADNYSDKAIVGTDCQRFKIKRVGKPIKKSSSKIYEKWFNYKEINRWINTGIDTDNSNMYAISVAFEMYLGVKSEGKFLTLENGANTVLIKPLDGFNDARKTLIRKCYRLPSGKLFIKNSYRGQIKEHGNAPESANCVIIYQRHNPFD